MNISEIIKSLSSLSQEDLKKLSDNIKFYLKHVDENLTYQELLYDSICEELKLYGIKTVHFNIFKKQDSVASKKLKECVKYLDNVIVDLCREDLKITRLLHKQLYNLFANIICEFLERNKIILCVTSVLNSYEHFNKLLDDKFPGYARHSLLYLLFSEDKNVAINKIKQKGTI